MLAVVWTVGVQPGDVLTAETVPIRVEAMKSEIAIKVPRVLEGKKVVIVAVAVGETVRAGQAMIYCE